MHKNLIILAGGASSRMKRSIDDQYLSKKDIAQANDRAKGLIGVGKNDRPILDYLLYNAKQAGYTDIFMVVNEKGLPLFNQYYGNNRKGNGFKGLKISFAIQHIPKNREKPLGTADALYQAIEQYPELKNQYFTVCNSDNLYSKGVLLALRTTDCENSLISYDREGLEFSSEKIARFALIQLDADNNLIDIIEKPKPESINDYKDGFGKLRVSMNIFKFNGQLFFPFLRDCPINIERDEKELPTALLNLLKNNPDSVKGIPLSEHVPDLTRKEDITIVRQYLKKNYPTLDWSSIPDAV